MALVLADRVQQTGTANTTVSFTLSGTVLGFQSFAVIGNGNTTYYSAFDVSGNWEVGIGTYSTTGPTLTRTTILASTSAGSAVTFSGTVTIFVTQPAELTVVQNDVGTAPNQIPLNQYLGGMAYEDKSGVSILGGAIDNTVIGGTTPAAGTFSTLRVNSTISLNGSTGTSGQVLTSNGTVLLLLGNPAALEH
jgi:hypothetical protein